MKGLSELIYEKSNKSNSDYKPGTVVPVMYDDNRGQVTWSLGYIRFGLNQKGELGAWFHDSKYNLDNEIGNYGSVANYIFVKFEDFDPDPKSDKKNIKNAFIELGRGQAAGEFILL